MSPLAQIENVGANIGRLRLRRADKRNALNLQLVGDATSAIDQMEGLGLEVGILASDGPVFCGGADLRENLAVRSDGPSPIDLLNRLLSSRLFWVAAVQGPAVGIGASLISVCPMSVVSRDAWFALPEMSFGVFPSAAVAYLEGRLGRQFCLEWALLNRRFPAGAPQMSPLVSVLCEADRVEAEAIGVAKSLAGSLPATRSARKAWQSLYRSAGFRDRRDEMADLLNEQLGSTPANI